MGTHGLACWAAHHFLAVAAPHPGAVDSRAVRVDIHNGNATVVADDSRGQRDLLALLVEDVHGKEEELPDVLRGALIVLGTLDLLLRAFLRDEFDGGLVIEVLPATHTLVADVECHAVGGEPLVGLLGGVLAMPTAVAVKEVFFLPDGVPPPFILCGGDPRLFRFLPGLR